METKRAGRRKGKQYGELSRDEERAMDELRRGLAIFSIRKKIALLQKIDICIFELYILNHER